MMKDTVLSVSELVNYLKTVVEQEPLFKNVAIVGELSNFTPHNSGHFYFSLKDEGARIKAVMFRTHTRSVLFKPENGMKVVVVGQLSVYQATGEVQLYIERMNLDGLGDLYIQYEKLKKDLESKGLFDDIHKKKIPEYPFKIGVITGDKSAALADMTRVLNERWPIATQINYITLVQGKDAAPKLTSAIEKANEDQVDVIVLARGGGSIEDLWAFNELEVVIAVFNSKVPIITGVGHETDTTLVDFVSDYRSATPTAAMTQATPNILDIHEEIRSYKNSMYRSVIQKIKHDSQTLEHIQSKRLFKEPISILDKYYMNLDIAQNRMTHQLRRFDGLRQKIMIETQKMNQTLLHNFERNEWVLKETAFTLTKNMNRILVKNNQAFDANQQALLRAQKAHLTLKKTAFNDILKSMKHLNPFEIMAKGYGALIHDEKPLTTIQDVSKNDVIVIRLTDGTLVTKVIERKTNDG